CPFDNAVIEGAGELPEVARLAQRHKQAFRDRLVATAAEAGAADPEALGRQLAVIFEGANALAASCNDAQVFTDARRAAKTLLDIALGAAPGG
ncbi:TetR/AcrR family transcriptional regulator, partial [Streptomyces decoyicus]